MTINEKTLVCFLIVISLMTGYGRSETIYPHIGYLYPAGGQRGHEVLITAGGQFLRRPEAVYISGEGVCATIVKHYRPKRNIRIEQRQLIHKELKKVQDKRIAELPASVRATMSPLPRNKPKRRNASDQPKKNEKAKDKNQSDVKMPEHPLLCDLENKSLRELAHIARMLFIPRSKLQPNRQIAETVLIKVSIAPDAKPGLRELRIKTAAGLTNPMVIQIGQIVEYAEMEPNDRQAYPTKVPRMPELPKAKPLELPVLLNGQIMPGDIDRFRFRASAGQQLVIETHARSLIPYLADAVPGWFQATVALYDAQGKEIAYADDYRFNPDPVLYYKIPKTGDYELAIRDSIYRGREDFVYRISVGQLPYITQMFPLGGKENEKNIASIEGWNLPQTQISLDTQQRSSSVRSVAYEKEGFVSNSIPYAVGTFEQCLESDKNDTLKDAQSVKLPIVVNGRINSAGDVDVFQFKGKAGDEIVAEVYARRLHSPMDSILRLMDASGKILEFNDDHVVKDDTHLHIDTNGLLTHHADSYLTAKLPSDGTYYVHLGDSQSHGGSAYGYRLQISAKEPDFVVYATPSSLSIPAGTLAPITIHVLRKNGFDGEISVSLKDAPAGFKLQGGQIPSGKDSIRMTIKAPYKVPDKPVALHLEGHATIDNKIITRGVTPSEDMMQAFLYRHLVPSEELLVEIQKHQWRVPPVRLPNKNPVAIPSGGSVQVRLKSQTRPFMKNLNWKLQDPPEGISLSDVKVMPEELIVALKVKKTVEKGLAENLIIEATREFTPKGKDGKGGNKKRSRSFNIIPAIPIRVTAPLLKENKKS